MGDKKAVENMVPEECAGCPHRVEQGESTGHGVIDAAARAEIEVLKTVTGEKQHKCGLCGCPLTNLALFNMVPSACPRTDEHGGKR